MLRWCGGTHWLAFGPFVRRQVTDPKAKGLEYTVLRSYYCVHWIVLNSDTVEHYASCSLENWDTLVEFSTLHVLSFSLFQMTQEEMLGDGCAARSLRSTAALFIYRQIVWSLSLVFVQGILKWINCCQCWCCIWAGWKVYLVPLFSWLARAYR